MKKSRFLQTIFQIGVILSLVSGFLAGGRLQETRAQTTPLKTSAIVLVNSASLDYQDFQHFIKPYLDHFGVPYTVLNIAVDSVGANIGDYALIVTGHSQLDTGLVYLDTTEQGYISSAVSAGTGLVNFDNDLAAIGSTPRYTFINDIFTFGYGASTGGSGVTFPATSHYITERHPTGSNISTGGMTLAGVTLPGDVTPVASSGTQPFLAVTTYGAGRAVQWGSYDWMSHSVKGPLYGLDDLVWRSMVWAARKPFVMQGMPPFVTMRSDDESGNFEWIHIANEFGIKPWAGLFYRNIDSAEAADLSALVHAGQATASIHAFNGSFFYYNHGSGDFSNETVAANFTDGTAWHQANNIPISKFVLPHYYEFGTNVFQGLEDWGVEFVGTQMVPGNGYGASWVMNGPFRLYEAGGSSSGYPMYYADYLSIPNHPEFNRQFFNCVTEIRDDAGYEWYPNLNDVGGTIGRGTRQTIRALDSMALATLFTHGYYVSGSWGATAPANWRDILQGITENISQYEPIYVTMDYACQYIRATYHSDITTGTYDPVTKVVTTQLQTVNGAAATDLATKFFVFMDGEGYVMVDVPVFSGSTTVEYTIPGPLDHIVVAPNPATVVAGVSQQFTATGYDSENNPIPNLTFNWSVVAGGGTINPSGLFTAGVTAGAYPDTVRAGRNGISATATVIVQEPVIHHFEFASITSPKYIGSPFTITIRARDQAGNLVPGYTGTVTLGDTTGTVSPASAGPFSGGIWSGQVTINAIHDTVTLTATQGDIQGTSNAFQVLALPTGLRSIWGSSGGADHHADGNSLEVGVKFRASTDGYITALRVYRSGNFSASLPGTLWSVTGTSLGTVTFPPIESRGWQEVAFPTPVAITADTTYVASYHTAAGYAVSRPYFTEANRSAYENPPLRALVDGEQGGNGVYLYSDSTTFPTMTYESSNYWVDVVFQSGEVEDTTPPTVHQTFPSAGATGVNPTADITVTFSEAMNGSSISAATFGLVDDENYPVAGVVSYDPVTFTARFDPGSTLGFSSTYAVRVVGGSSGVEDLAGNSMAADHVWSFTTTAAPPTLDHFEISAIPSPQIAGTPFQITVTARDNLGGIYSAFTGSAGLAVSAGTLSPLTTGSFTNGTWSGPVTVQSASALSGVTLTASDGAVSGVSNPFDLQLAPVPPFYTVTSTSYTQLAGEPFEVTVTAYPGATINLWEDNHQYPVLETTTDSGQIIGTDGKWTEFLYTQSRPYPTILAGVDEEDYGLPVMRFYAGGIPNGEYQVVANLYDNSPMRYYYGFSATNPKEFNLVVPGGATGTQHREYSLGTVAITDGNFNLYVRDADILSTTNPYPFFGWAWIRLVPVEEDQQINLWEDNHQDPVLATTTDPGRILGTDGLWTEFLYTQSRPYPTILAGVNEETVGLPTLRFYAGSIPNGEYQVMANLYDNSPMRYYYGFSAANPKELNVVVPGGATGTQHREYSLGTVTITDGNFNLYVRDADQLGGTYPFFGWAWIRLVKTGVQMSSTSTTMQFDADGDGVFGEPGDDVKRLVNGSMVIQARDTSTGRNVPISAADGLGRSGENRYTLYTTASVPLVSGWNLVSLPLEPLNSSLAAVLAGLGLNYDIVYAWDAASQNWLIHDRRQPQPADTLTSMDCQTGYWVHLTAASPQELTVQGTRPLTASIWLHPGWNLVAYPGGSPAALPEVLTEHGVPLEDLGLVYAQQGSPPVWKIYDPALGPGHPANTLTHLEPGWGYWVKYNGATPTLWLVGE